MSVRTPDHGDGTEWGSLLGLPIPLSRIRLHFWSFSAAVTSFTAFNIAARIAALPQNSPEPLWHRIPPLLTVDIVPTAIFCGIFSPIGVEVTAMVIAAYYSRRKRRENLETGRTEGFAEGRAKGLDEANSVWQEWNRRRIAAETAGQPFDEPPPDFSNRAGHTANP